MVYQSRERFPNLWKYSEMHPFRDLKSLQFAVRTTKTWGDFANVLDPFQGSSGAYFGLKMEYSEVDDTGSTGPTCQAG